MTSLPNRFMSLTWFLDGQQIGSKILVLATSSNFFQVGGISEEHTLL
jgi:hypothetical protein